jgi:hypothetical protein
LQPKASRKGDRLLVTTLALEAAVIADDWTEVENLLQARQAILNEIGDGAGVSEAMIQKSADVEQRVLSLMKRDQRGVIEALREVRVTTAAAKAYRARGRRVTDLSIAA